MEDNFDATYNCHFKIPVDKLVSIERYIPESTPSSSKQERTSVLRSPLGIAAALGGVLILKLRFKNAMPPYLKVHYKTETDGTGVLFFEDCDINKMVKAYKKFRATKKLSN